MLIDFSVFSEPLNLKASYNAGDYRLLKCLNQSCLKTRRHFTSGATVLY